MGEVVMANVTTPPASKTGNLGRQFPQLSGFPQSLVNKLHFLTGPLMEKSSFAKRVKQILAVAGPQFPGFP